MKVDVGTCSQETGTNVRQGTQRLTRSKVEWSTEKFLSKNLCQATNPLRAMCRCAPVTNQRPQS